MVDVDNRCMRSAQGVKRTKPTGQFLRCLGKQWRLAVTRGHRSSSYFRMNPTFVSRLFEKAKQKLVEKSR